MGVDIKASIRAKFSRRNSGAASIASSGSFTESQAQQHPADPAPLVKQHTGTTRGSSSLEADLPPQTPRPSSPSRPHELGHGRDPPASLRVPEHDNDGRGQTLASNVVGPGNTPDKTDSTAMPPPPGSDRLAPSLPPDSSTVELHPPTFSLPATSTTAALLAAGSNNLPSINENTTLPTRVTLHDDEIDPLSPILPPTIPATAAG